MEKIRIYVNRVVVGNLSINGKNQDFMLMGLWWGTMCREHIERRLNFRSKKKFLITRQDVYFVHFLIFLIIPSLDTSFSITQSGGELSLLYCYIIQGETALQQNLR